MKSSKSNKTVLFLLLAGTLLFSYCKKESDDIDTIDKNKVTTVATLTEFFKKYGAQSQYFTVPSNTTTTITGEKGTIIAFPDSAFVDRNGYAVSGNIEIELKEVLTVADMILSNKPTVDYNNEILVSGGELYIRASLNNEVLKINRDVEVSIPTNNPDSNMYLFSGIETSSGIVDWWNDGGVVWRYSAFSITQDSLTNQFFYSTLVNSFVLDYGWINCDRFYNDTMPKTDIVINPVILSADSSQVNIALFLVFKGINSVMKVYQKTARNIPIGMDAIAVGIGIGKENAYFSSQAFTVTANQTIDLQLNKTKESDIPQLVKNL